MVNNHKYIWCVSFFAIIATCTGCSQSIWRSAYNSNFSAAYYDGWNKPTEDELRSARHHGEELAEEDLAHAKIWWLYYPLALNSLAAGIVVGVTGQYLAILYCRWNQEIYELPALLFIPAFKLSRAYPTLELISQSRQQIKRLHIIRQVKAWQAATIRHLFVDKVRAQNAIEAESQAAMLKAAMRDLDKIIEDGEYLANSSNEICIDSQTDMLDSMTEKWRRSRKSQYPFDK